MLGFTDFRIVAGERLRQGAGLCFVCELGAHLCKVESSSCGVVNHVQHVHKLENSVAESHTSCLETGKLVQLI